MAVELLKQTLKGLGKPVYRLSYNPTQKDLKKTPPAEYIAFQAILTQPSGYADDDSTSVVYYFSVDLFTSGDFTELLKETITALKQAGFTVSSVDGEIYEKETGYYHVPISINILEE